MKDVAIVVMPCTSSPHTNANERSIWTHIFPPYGPAPAVKLYWQMWDNFINLNKTAIFNEHFAVRRDNLVS